MTTIATSNPSNAPERTTRRERFSRVMNVRRLCRWYFVTVALVLIITAIAKTYSVVVPSSLAQVRHPLFSFLSVRSVLTLGVALEMIVLLILCFSQNNSLKLYSIIALASAFLSYRLALHLAGIGGSCDSLGKIHFPGFSPTATNYTMLTILIYLLFGAYILIYLSQISSAPASLEDP
jgi:hypothetical protein